VDALLALPRLLAALWILMRADLIVPKEVGPSLPWWGRLLGHIVRIGTIGTSITGRPGERLARVCERLGPATIKLGQLLSTRGDIFGKSFADDLSRLKDQLPPFANATARDIIEAELGLPIREVFAELSGPIAAASLAQAHPGRLIDGRAVAVKVLRPGIEKRVRADSQAMRLAAWLAALVPPLQRLEPRAFVDTVIRTLDLELDLRFEAAGADELGAIMAQDAYMQAPAVVWSAVSQRVLTLEWASGRPLTLTEVLEDPDLDRPALANNLIRGFLAQALDHGVFHADLHEGNLFVAPPAKVVVLDYGIIGRLGPTERRFLAEILFGFLQKDYARVAQVHFDAGYVPAHHSPSAFAQALRAVGQTIFGQPASKVSMGRLLTQLFDITSLFDMHLRPELVMLQKTMMTVEGVARRIDPEHDIWTAADPVVRRWIQRELSPVTKIQSLSQDVGKLLRNLSALTEPKPPAKPASTRSWPLLWFGLGALVSGVSFWLAQGF
jgi:ubiquinone biosynthesis protein